MSNINITNINNKPLKCVITNNKSAIKYFSSNTGTGKEPYTGTLIVLEYPTNISNNYKYSGNYREIYLNDKFLAGGYGFENDEIVEQLREIAQNYYSTIERIDTTEQSTSARLEQSINEKLDKEGQNANASNVYFIYNDSINKHKLYMNDIIELLSKVPQYKDIEIISIQYGGTYVGYNSKLTDFGGNIINSNEIKYYDINSFTLPINAKLESLYIKVVININHAGGLTDLKALYRENKASTVLTEIPILNYENNIDIFNLNFGIVYNTNTNPYIIDEDNQVVASIQFKEKATSPDKYQSVVLSNGANILYSANAIPDQIKNINLPNIKGSYYLVYSISKSQNNELNINANTGFDDQNDGKNHKKYQKIIVNNENENKFTYIDLDKGLTQIALILPYRFKIRHAFLINGTDEHSITNFLNYYEHTDSNNFIQNKLKSNLYYIKISGDSYGIGLKNSYQLKLDIIEDESISYSMMNIDEEDRISFVGANKTNVLNSDEIHKYWINENNIENIINRGLDVILNYNKL